MQKAKRVLKALMTKRGITLIASIVALALAAVGLDISQEDAAQAASIIAAILESL